jgi:hypothetical protein
MERALELALEVDSPGTAGRWYGHLADSCASYLADVERCFELQAEGRRIAERVTRGPLLTWLTGERTTELYLRGRWDEAAEIGERLVERMSRARNPHFIEVPTRWVLSQIALGHGDDERAEHESSVALERGRAVGDLQVLYGAFAWRAVVLLETGRDEAARSIVSEFIEHLGREVERTGQTFTPWAERLILVWLCVRYEYANELARLFDATRPWPVDSPWTPLVRAIFERDLVTAASRAEERGLLPDAAFLRLKGRVEVERALAFYRQVGATRYVAEAEKLLAA